jgi:copper chaperone CopZ
MTPLTLDIAGMSCAHCVGRVANALKTVAGVEVEHVKIGSATLSYDPAITSPEQIAATVANAGYSAQPAGHVA